jgi:hypothetical protein
MENKYKNEGEIHALVRSFENATISEADWRHAEHLAVALFYLTRGDIETATEKMRDGLFNLLTKGFAVNLTKEMPYHETLTVFWMRAIAAFNASKDGASLVEKANELVAVYDKDYPLKFYSRERLFSNDARARFVEPDLAEPLTALPVDRH